MSEIALTVDHIVQGSEPGDRAADLFTDRGVIAVTVDGTACDLDTEIHNGQVVTPIQIDSDEGLAILRHSTAHVMAQAVQQLFGESRLGIGPPIRDGFYYDFDVETPFTPEDLSAIEKLMGRIVKEGQTFRRRVVTEAQAQAELADEPYKLELIGLKGSSSVEGADAEVGGAVLTIYDNLRRDGSAAWSDLCRGPHLPNTKLIGNGFKVQRSAAAYWRGDEKNPQLQRLYGTAWPSKDALKAYLERMAEAERRDHRRIGAEMDLFSFPEVIGSGLPIFHPRGGIIRRELEEYSRRRHAESGYEFVNSPHITKGALFELSSHLDWYRDSMYPPMHLDEELNEDGSVRRAGQDYYLKPMNCPFHNLIFGSRGRSYRELPLRMFEFGTVYRYEKSGVVHGLTRVRGLTQDDAHIYVTEDQVEEELTSVLEFVLGLLRDYGLDDFYLELSTKNPEKYLGDDDVWDRATETLAKVAQDSGLELVLDPGGAAFYGPKISVQVQDAIGRSWQMSTVQLDFMLPDKFELEYMAADGTRKRPVMIHRALFGSIERFFGILTEHYAGAFPPWLAPVQVVAIPVADAFNEYLQTIVDRLKAQGVRAELDEGDDRFPKKIRTASKQKVPFVLIAGGEDQDAGAVSFRYRDGSQDNGVPIDEAIERIVEAVRSRAQV